MNGSRILAVEHVELESPPGIEEELRWFYGELAQLEEVSVPGDAENHRLRFRSARIELRLQFLHDPRIDEVTLRTTILVPSLVEVVEQCRVLKIPFARVSGVVRADRRIQLLDPARNRIELKQGWANAPI